MTEWLGSPNAPGIEPACTPDGRRIAACKVTCSRCGAVSTCPCVSRWAWDGGETWTCPECADRNVDREQIAKLGRKSNGP